MSTENKEYPDNSKQSAEASSEMSKHFIILERYLASIRAASWLSAIGILALVVYTVK